MIIIETISLSDAFKYPFKEPKRLLYALLVLIPIFGWIVLFGYTVRLINEFIEGRYEGLIKIEIIDDLKLGFSMFMKYLPLVIILLITNYAVNHTNLTLGLLIQLLLSLFVLPLLIANFMRKKTIGSCFEFGVLNVIKENPGDYIIAILKQYALTIIFLILSIILIGIPALLFTNTIFMANFYGRNIEQLNDPAFKPQLNKLSTD